MILRVDSSDSFMALDENNSKEIRRSIRLGGLSGSVGVWAALTCGPVLALILSRGKLAQEDIQVLLALFAVAIVGSLWLNFVTGGGTSGPRRIVWGICLGLLLPVAGGYAWMKINHSFESPAIFWGGVILSIPSAIGGGLAGWIQSRAR